MYLHLLKKLMRLWQDNYPDFEICWFGHIGDGNLHLNILKPADLKQR
jgi:FAD/FMN-containing dehydrogenase